MIAYNMLSMDCAYIGAFAPFYFTFCLSPRERRVTRTHPFNAVPRHDSLIEIFRFVLVGSTDLHYCFYIRGRVGIEIKCPNVFHFELLRLIESMFPLHVLDASICEHFPCLEEYCRNAIGGKEIETKLKIFCCLFPPPPGYGSSIFRFPGNQWFFSKTRHALGMRPGEFQDYYCDCNSGLPAVKVIEGWFRFINFLEAQTCDPGAPQGPLGSLRARRNYANSLGVSQVPLWPFAIALFHCFGPGAPQGSCGPFVVLEHFLGISIVHRAAPGVLQVSFGSLGTFGNVAAILIRIFDPREPPRARGIPGGSLTALRSLGESFEEFQGRRPHWLACCWDPGEGVLENL